MTPESKRLVREGWDRVEPVAEVAAALFYGRLFELDPALRHLFRGDMAERGRALMRTLADVVRGLDELTPAAEGPGGAGDARHETAGAALLWALQRALGEAFTPAARHAWGQAYEVLAAVTERAAACVPGLPPTVAATGAAGAAAD